MSGFSWADVENDVLILLAERIVGVTSFIRLSAVCKSWHMIGSVAKCCYQFPWLMLAEREGSELRDFYDHSTREVYQLTLPQAKGMKNLGFSHEWLITGSEGGPLHILNPLTGALIDLPPSQTLDVCFKQLTPTEIRDIVPIRATASPIGRNGDCIVALIRLGYRLSYCRSGDAEWARVPPVLYNAYEIAYIGGAFYTVTCLHQIFRVEFGSTQRSTRIADLPGDVDNSGTSRFYLVEFAGEILVVVRKYTCWSWNVKNFVTANFRVFKLDIEGRKVQEVKGIGDHVLFLGTNDSICIPIVSSTSRHLLMKNCIYFTDNRYGHRNAGIFEVGEDMGVYNLDDGTITPHYPGTSKFLYSFPIWVTINPFK